MVCFHFSQYISTGLLEGLASRGCMRAPAPWPAVGGMTLGLRIIIRVRGPRNGTHVNSSMFPESKRPCLMSGGRGKENSLCRRIQVDIQDVLLFAAGERVVVSPPIYVALVVKTSTTSIDG